MVADPLHRYSNESELANKDIHDDLKLKQEAWSPVPYNAGSDFRRQILTSKVDPRTVRVKIFIRVADP